ncbi:MAG: exodeoxyribonuclease VII large subunit, partial [Muribaculaceae bacterium]|nr:exodeoxyribonuclease VII large subunit [Muribaculaceae bacterium]
VNDIDPSYTLGDIERLRREILMRLHREGVLTRNKERVMPIAPQRIAVISAEGAAGYGDFINQLMGNAYGFVFYPHLFPAVMQGDKTSSSVRSALERVYESREMWDCVAIVRGGGATTDLNGFDDYELARSVAVFPLPVVVGIGHERDRTVLDEIAHTRQKTPTAVASFFIDTLRAASDRTAGMVDWIARYCTDRLLGESRRLSNCEGMIPALAEARLSGARALLEREVTRIPVLVSARLSESGSRIDAIGRMLGVLADSKVRQSHENIVNMSERIAIAADSFLKRTSATLESLSGMVEVLSPSNTLRRGYSITRVGGKAVTDAATLKKGARIETQFFNGKVESEIIEDTIKDK